MVKQITNIKSKELICNEDDDTNDAETQAVLVTQSNKQAEEKEGQKSIEEVELDKDGKVDIKKPVVKNRRRSKEDASQKEKSQTSF